METVEIVDELKARGLKLEMVGGVLKVGPRSLINDETAAVIRDNTADLLAYLTVDDVDVQWRVAAMLEQLLPLSWPCPVPLLYALDVEQYGPADCSSCGKLRDTVKGDTQICGACCRAKAIALELWLQRPTRKERAA